MECRECKKIGHAAWWHMEMKKIEEARAKGKKGPLSGGGGSAKGGTEMLLVDAGDEEEMQRMIAESSDFYYDKGDVWMIETDTARGLKILMVSGGDDGKEGTREVGTRHMDRVGPYDSCSDVVGTGDKRDIMAWNEGEERVCMVRGKAYRVKTGLVSKWVRTKTGEMK
jgi:hypothetical protein